MANDLYTGYKIINMDEEQLAHFYNDPNCILDNLLENEYALISFNNEICDKYQRKNGKLKKVSYRYIDNEFHGIVKPRNIEQELAFNMLQDKTIPIKVLTGTYGSFKTGAMIVHALEEVSKGHFKKLVWVRNNYNVAGTNDVGYLAGSLQEKLAPWAGPLMDHCGGPDGMQSLIDQEQIEIVHIGYLRGRSIDNSILLCSEAQNLTISHVALLLGRVGEKSQIWMEGDFHGQQDNKLFEKSRGIETCIKELKGNPLFGYVHLLKTERSEVAKCANLFQKYL